MPWRRWSYATGIIPASRSGARSLFVLRRSDPARSTSNQTLNAFGTNRSFCNEGGCLAAPAGTGSIFREQAYEYDATRPVLGNHNGGDLNKYMDVQGFSHKPGSAFEAYHKTDPSK
jgi:hypothetical protein